MPIPVCSKIDREIRELLPQRHPDAFSVLRAGFRV
jgi:hypothetical protein